MELRRSVLPTLLPPDSPVPAAGGRDREERGVLCRLGDHAAVLLPSP